MSTHNIYFSQEIKKNVDTFWLKKAPCQKLCHNVIILFILAPNHILWILIGLPCQDLIKAIPVCNHKICFGS